MKIKICILFIVLFLFTIPVLAHPNHEPVSQDECAECIEFMHRFENSKFWKIHHKEAGSFSLSLGMQWWLPIGDLFDHWDDGFGFTMHFDFWLTDKVTLGFMFMDIDLDPNSAGFAADTTGWDTNIYSWSFAPKYFLLPDRIFLSPHIGWFGIRRNIPNFISLDTATQDALGNENTLGTGGEIGVLIWNFVIFGVGYNYIFDEGQTMFIDLSFHL